MTPSRAMFIVHVVLRSVQIAFGIIVLGCAGFVVDQYVVVSTAYSSWDSFNWWGRRRLMSMLQQEGDLQAPGRHLLEVPTPKAAGGIGVFAGLLAFLAALFFLLMTLKPSWLKHRAPRTMGIIEAAVSGLVAVFFLAAGGALSALSTQCGVADCGVLHAANAFCWLSFILWLASFVFALLEVLRVFPRSQPRVDAGAPKAAAMPGPALPVHASTQYANPGPAPYANPAPAPYANPAVKVAEVPAATGPIILTTQMDLEAPAPAPAPARMQG